MTSQSQNYKYVLYEMTRFRFDAHTIASRFAFCSYAHKIYGGYSLILQLIKGRESFYLSDMDSQGNSSRPKCPYDDVFV